MARITEEVGELAREVNHRYGPKKKKETEDSREIEEEVADVIFALICLSNSLNLDIDRGFKSAMNKCYERDKDRYDKK